MHCWETWYGMQCSLLEEGQWWQGKNVSKHEWHFKVNQKKRCKKFRSLLFLGYLILLNLALVLQSAIWQQCFSPWSSKYVLLHFCSSSCMHTSWDRMSLVVPWNNEVHLSHMERTLGEGGTMAKRPLWGQEWKWAQKNKSPLWAKTNIDFCSLSLFSFLLACINECEKKLSQLLNKEFSTDDFLKQGDPLSRSKHRKVKIPLDLLNTLFA